MHQLFSQLRKDYNMKYLPVVQAVSLAPQNDATWQSEIPATMKRRDPRIWHMAYVAAARLLKLCNVKPKSVLIGTALGALDETRNFLDGVFTDGFGSPKNFIASVHNSMAGKIALDFMIQGPNLTFCDGQNSFASAIAACSLLTPDDFPSLVIAVDESIPLFRDIIPHLPGVCKDQLASADQEGAVAIIVDPRAASFCAQIKAVGPTVLQQQTETDFITSCLHSSNGSSQEAIIVSRPENKSFVGAAFSAATVIASHEKGRFLVPSYSPSSDAFAAIDILI
jgi:hypothetical protein